MLNKVHVNYFHIMALGLALALTTATQAQEVSLTKIHDDGTYNAFTDLAKFQGDYYCTFRSAISHGGASHGVMGEIVVIRSSDTKEWGRGGAVFVGRH